MTTLYQLFIFIHIASAIVTIGPCVAFYPLLKKLKTDNSSVKETYLEIIKLIVTLSKHGGHVLIVSGALLVIFGPWAWTTPWLIVTFILLISSAFFIAKAFSPTLRKFNNPDQDEDKLIFALKKAMTIYLALLLVVLWLMVSKPTF